MGNCVRCGRSKKPGEIDELGPEGVKEKKRLKNKKDKSKNKEDHKKGSKTKTEGLNGRAEDQRIDDIEEKIKVVKITPLEKEAFHASKDHSLGPQERKVLRLVLPYIPKKQWGKLREVCKTWCAVVDGEWARTHTIHLPELLPHGPDHRGTHSEKSRLVADHVSSTCQLSRSIISTPGHDAGIVIDLTDEEFWSRLLPRTNDLTTLRLHEVHLPKYFFTHFLPQCRNLEILEITEAAGRHPTARGESWNDADRERLKATIADLDKLTNVRVELSQADDPVRPNHFDATLPLHESRMKDYSTPISSAHNGYPSMGDSHYAPMPAHDVPYVPRDVDAILSRTAGPHLKSFAYDRVPLTPKVLNTLSTCPNLSSLSFDLNLDLLSPYDHEKAILKCFSALEHLRDLRINIISNERNVYPTLQTLAYILKIVAEYSKQLNTLKLIRMPDPMGVDKPLATDISTAFVKLNDETQLNQLHVCVLAPSELFHVWSLPWPALTRLHTLTLTDCNLYPERPRGIDLEAMPNLTTFTLCSDSLDDDMVNRVFAQPHATITDLTLEPGPRGLGRGGLRTVALACQNLRHLTISYSRTRDQNKHNVDVHGWTAFFRVVLDSLKSITLIDIDRGYFNDDILPVSRQCPNIETRPVHDKASFDTFADRQPVANGRY